jgi:hypothetical protein
MPRNFLWVTWIAVLLASCGGRGRSDTALKFELRDFVVKEDKTAATSYSKEWNAFKGTGTLVLTGESFKDRNIMVWLEIRDEAEGSAPVPMHLLILVKSGIGRVEFNKSTYNTLLPQPKINWAVLGWVPLERGSLEVK